MLCEHLGIVENNCVHRSRYNCPPVNERVPITGITLSCSGNRRAVDVEQGYNQPLPNPVPCNDLPNSVHYLVRSNGNVDQLVPWTCYTYAGCAPLDNYLHILLEGDSPTSAQLKAAARLACCLARAFNLIPETPGDPVNIVTLYSLDATKDCLTAIPPAFWTAFNACLLGEDVILTQPELACCDEVRANLLALTNLVNSLENRITALEARPDLEPRVVFLENAVTVLGTQVGTLTTQITSLQNLVYELGARIVKLEECFKKLPQCNETLPCGQAEYAITNCQQFPPNVANIINFNRKIEDPDNIVTTGPLWCAQVGDGFNPARTYRVQGCVTVSQRRWCVGKQIIIYLEDCAGNQIQVANWISPANGPQPPITMCFDQVVPVPPSTLCCVRIRYWTNDVTDPFSEICTGDIRLTRS
jgi:hypothetical protein